MIQTDIAKTIGCTRANVSQCLRNAVKKVYTNIMKNEIADHPYEAFEVMSVMFDLKSQEDYNELYRLMPSDAKERIREYGQTKTL